MVMPPGAAATISSARSPRSRVWDPAFLDGAGTAAVSSEAGSTSVIGAHFAHRSCVWTFRGAARRTDRVDPSLVPPEEALTRRSWSRTLLHITHCVER